MKNAKILNLIKVQKELKEDCKVYNVGVDNLVKGAKGFILGSSITEIEDNVQLIIQSLYLFGKPIKNVRGIIREFSNSKPTYFFKKGSFTLLYNRSIKPIGEMMLTDGQIKAMDKYVKENKKNLYDSKFYFEKMFMAISLEEDSYKTFEAFKCLVRSVIGSVVILKTEAVSNKNISDLKKECVKMDENFSNICLEENLLIAS